MKYPVVEAVWVDHSFTIGDDPPAPIVFRSVGYLVKDSKNYIVLAQSLNKMTKHPEETLVILKGALKKMQPR